MVNCSTNDFSSTAKKAKSAAILKDKWKFVRNVMDNMERQKKMPLKDCTSRHINTQRSNMTGITAPMDKDGAGSKSTSF